MAASALGACGGSEPRPADSRAEGHAGEAGGYSLHEWGVITMDSSGGRSGSVEGPMLPMVVVEKPVIYLHAEAPLVAEIGVELGPGVTLVEHYPESASTSPLRWRVNVLGSACRARHAYPSACTASDGLCEVLELARYEAADASCLEVGGTELPLLFYRLRSEPTIELPIELRIEGPRAELRSRSGAPIRAWRITWDGRERRASAVTAGADWAAVRSPEGPVGEAAEALAEALAAQGLSEPERAAFQRAWWAELFSLPAPVEAAPAEITPVMAERPPPGSTEEDVVEEYIPTGPRYPDVLLYLMPAASIDTVARIEASPPPRETSRAFLIRQVL